MAAINGRRPRRINNDGKSITELATSAVDLLPGTFVGLDANAKFVKATAAGGSPAGAVPMYIVNVDDLTGQGILDVIKAGESVTGDYVEQGRQFSALVKAGSVLKKDTKLMMGATGVLEVWATATPDPKVVAYSQEVFTVPASPAGGSHVRVRIA